MRDAQIGSRDVRKQAATMQSQCQSGVIGIASSVREERGAGLISHGVPFRLSAEDGALLGLMKEHAPHGSVPSRRLPADARRFALRRARRKQGYEVFADDELLLDAEALDDALILLGGHMMIHVAEHAPEYVFLHAGVVAWKDRALLLPGVSHAGKSTLVAELVRAGATYYSDEFALLDSQGRVHPFARDIRMRRPGAPDQVPLPLKQLNGREGMAPLLVSMVVFAEFVEHARWAPEAVTPGRAVLEMLRHSVPVQRTPERTLATLSAMMRHARAWKSQRGEAALAARSLLAALATGGPPA
jgi:hypothetical protein